MVGVEDSLGTVELGRLAVELGTWTCVPAPFPFAGRGGDVGTLEGGITGSPVPGSVPPALGKLGLGLCEEEELRPISIGAAFAGASIGSTNPVLYSSIGPRICVGHASLFHL